MPGKACNQDEPTPPAKTGPFATVVEAVAALAPQLNELEKTAERRLRQAAGGEIGGRLLAQANPMDFVLHAIYLVLAGSQNPHSGRKTRPRHLRSLAAFRYHVQNVLCSRIGHELERMRRQGQHLPIGPESPDSPCVDPPAGGDVVREVCLRETRRELFARLWPYANGRGELMNALELWSEGWRNGSRQPDRRIDSKEVYELKKRARRVLAEMARRDGQDLTSGSKIISF